MNKIILFCISMFYIGFTANSQTNFGSKNPISIATGANPFAIDSGQLTADSYNDIVIGTDGGNTVEWYKNNGNGTFASGITLTTGGDLLYVEGIHIADINNDGFKDILATGYGDDKLVWFENNGNDTFEPAVNNL